MLSEKNVKEYKENQGANTFENKEVPCNKLDYSRKFGVICYIGIYNLKLVHNLEFET